MLDDPFATLGPELWLRVGVAALCGAIVGLERQLDGKPMGVRTGILVSMGTASFVYLGEVAGVGGDPARVLGQVITGVGFLGAGVLFHQKDGAVTGLTTATTVWLLAAIGAAAGLGWCVDAVGLSLATVAVLSGLRSVERRMSRMRRGAHGEGGAED